MNKLFFLFLLAGFIPACRNKEKISTDNSVNFGSGSALSNLKFRRTRMDFGIVPADTTLTAKYDFVNTGTDSLVINYISPDCSCTGYQVSKDRIAPKDSAYVVLKLSTKHKTGNVEVYSTICTNTPAKFYILKIAADVR